MKTDNERRRKIVLSGQRIKEERERRKAMPNPDDMKGAVDGFGGSDFEQGISAPYPSSPTTDFRYPRSHIQRCDIEELAMTAQLAMARGYKTMQVSSEVMYRLCEKMNQLLADIT